ncbi:MAG: histidine kinase dimerization/phospho-acceptor domain-containing protein [Polyangiaceae bacterium]
MEPKEPTRPEFDEAELKRWAALLRRFIHDLRNPLTVIKTNVAYLKETDPAELVVEAPAVLEDLEQAIDQAEKLLSQLNQDTAHARDLLLKKP